jgi:hypothetical protein
MSYLVRTMRRLAAEKILWSIVLLALALRLVGVGYGLPLTVVSDEYPFTYAALQMIQSHTVVPALHPDVFKNILPYPPYLSYLLLVPFVVILALKYVLFGGSVAVFSASVVSDLSSFFIVARLVSVCAGVVSVYFVYRISERILQSSVAAGCAAFLTATSLLHIALSMVGRNWILVSFVLLSTLMILSYDRFSRTRRYLLAFVLAGVGMGISSVCALSIFLMGMYYLLFDAPSLREVRRDATLLLCGALGFIALALIPWLLWHGGNAFVGAMTLGQPKTLLGLLGSPWSVLSLFLAPEPILFALSIGGTIALLQQKPRAGTLLLGWFVLYTFVFYVAFRFEHRFFVPLVPILAIAGGYALSCIWSTRLAPVVLLVLFVPLIAAARLSYLAYHGDTRVAALHFVRDTIAHNEKILVFSSGLHVPTQKAAVDALAQADQGAVRKVDEADWVLDRSDVPFAFNNLTSIKDSHFVAALPEYAKKRRLRLPARRATVIYAAARNGGVRAWDCERQNGSDVVCRTCGHDVDIRQLFFPTILESVRSVFLRPRHTDIQIA